MYIHDRKKKANNIFNLPYLPILCFFLAPASLAYLHACIFQLIYQIKRKPDTNIFP